jgi:hypothetical protein
MARYWELEDDSCFFVGCHIRTGLVEVEGYRFCQFHADEWRLTHPKEER